MLEIKNITVQADEQTILNNFNLRHPDLKMGGVP